MVFDDDDRPIEKKFTDSWDWIEQFYGDELKHGGLWAKSMPDLINELRLRGYDKVFRAGQSLYFFVLSRSQKWGLRDEQARLRIDVHREGGMTIGYYSLLELEEFEVNFDRVELTPEFEQLLSKLLAHPIN